MDVSEHKGLVYAVINRRRNPINVGLRQKKYLSMEDIEQAGMIGLWKAIKMFDPSKGAKFSTYAYTWIQGEIFNTLRFSTKGKKRLEERTRYIKPTKTDGTKEGEEGISDSYDLQMKVDDSQFWVKEFTESLDDELQKILRYRMNNYSQREITEIMGFNNFSSVQFRLDKIKYKYKMYNARRNLG